MTAREHTPLCMNCGASQTATGEEIARLSALNERLLTALEDMEWRRVDKDGWSRCPSCYALKGDSHTDVCEIGSAIAAARQEQEDAE